jgi:quercetin dioxygenase-like cupin family protein
MTMKNAPSMVMGVLIPASVLIFAPGTVRAQDPVKVAPNNFRVLLENDRVRVLDFHGKPGEKVPMHSHPAYVTYSIHGSGKTKFTLPDGKITERPATTGEARWRDAETHASEYVGTGEAHVLLVELKAGAASGQKP